MDPAARKRLEGAGVTFYEYLDVAGLLARVSPEAVDTLRAMQEAGQVRYVGPIPAEGKVAKALWEKALAAPQEEYSILVELFEEATPAQEKELGALLSIEGRSEGPSHLLNGQATGEAIRALAQLEYVKWIEELGTWKE